MKNPPKQVEDHFTLDQAEESLSALAVSDLDLMRIHGRLDRDENFFRRFSGGLWQLKNNVAAVG